VGKVERSTGDAVLEKKTRDIKQKLCETCEHAVFIFVNNNNLIENKIQKINKQKYDFQKAINYTFSEIVCVT